MASYCMCNGISQSVRDKVKQINKVWVAKLRKYCKEFYPRSNFDKALLLIRSVAQHGYAYGAKVYGVSKQYAEATLNRYYERAKEAEKWQENF